jgi:hypothetical protein
MRSEIRVLHVHGECAQQDLASESSTENRVLISPIAFQQFAFYLVAVAQQCMVCLKVCPTTDLLLGA